jgi:hypothetical protein
VSSITWTPVAVASEARAWRGMLWRVVEAQNRVSTSRLVDTLQEQALLEDLLETSKPAVPPTRAPRHYLITTPFRYPSPWPGGSRFRAATDPGVFYGADERRTACAELGYWRWMFLRASPSLKQLQPLPQTLFQVEVTGRATDLTQPPLSADVAHWTDRNVYGVCQQLAQVCREAGADIIRYQSVRDPAHGLCAAVLSPDAFTAAALVEQSWQLTVDRERVRWRRDSVIHDESFEFTAAGWQ